MFAQFSKKSLVSKVVLGIVLMFFIFSGVSLRAYADVFTAGKLRKPSAGDGAIKNELADALRKSPAGKDRFIETIVKSRLGKDLSHALTVTFYDVDKNNVAVVGGKGANLGELQQVKEVSVPHGVAVTTRAFQLHLDNSTTEITEKQGEPFLMSNEAGTNVKITLKDFIEHRMENVDFKNITELEKANQDIEAAKKSAQWESESKKKITLREFIEYRLKDLVYNDSVALAKAGEELRHAIYLAEMPQEVKEAITKGYKQLCDEAGVVDLPVAVRSSATAEDTQNASFAGQQDTYLNISGIDDVLDAVKRDWASLFTDRAIFYRHKQKIEHGQAYLSAVIQRMVESRTAGTAFSVSTDTGADFISIDGAWGLGEGVVSGTVSPDSWLVKKDKNGKFSIYRKVFGAKLKKVAYKKEKSLKAKEGTEVVDTSYQERHTFSLTDEQVITLAKAVDAIHNHYGQIMDIEWGFDAQGKLWILQARPETVWSKWNESNPHTVKMENTVIPNDVADAQKASVILTGISGTGAVTGNVIIVDGSKEGTELAKELDRVKEGDLLVTTMTKPDMVPALERAGGIVTDEGGPTCHAAIVARELGKPCVVGTGKATQTLKEGMRITVDANNGVIYSAPLEVEKIVANIEPLKLPVTKTEIGVIVASPFLAMKVSGLSEFPSAYGVGLLRKEFVDTTEILVHPLAGLYFDMYNDPEFKDEKLKQWIKEKIIDNVELRTTIEDTIKGYSSFAEFFKDKLANTIAVIAATQKNGQRVKFRTTDFKTNEYKNQIGGTLFEPEENNPMMGYRGINRMLSEAYKRAFELEIEAIKKARELQNNIDVMFPVVRTPKELKEAIDLFAKHGLVRGQNGFQIGMMVEVPANIFQAEEFFQLVDFISIGSNDLTQFTMALGRDNDMMKKFFSEASPAVKRALEIVIKTAKKYDVTSGLCGQRPSNDPAFASVLVEFGIDSISVTPDAFAKVVKVVKAAEEKMAGKEFNPNIVGWAIPEKEGNPERIISNEVDAGTIIKNILRIHPKVFMAYDKGEIKEDILRSELEQKFDGKTAKEYVTGIFYDAIMNKIKATPVNKSIIYNTDDLNKTVYESLLGDGNYELFDENSALGFCGLVRVVDPEYQEFFRWQLEALKKAREDSGRKNISIKLNLARTLDEVSKALELIKSAGFTLGQDGFMVGMELSGPSNVLLLKEFTDLGISFLTENNERFLSYDLAMDPGSEYVRISDAEKEEALKNPRRIWTKFAEDNKMPLIKASEEVDKAAEKQKLEKEAVSNKN